MYSQTKSWETISCFHFRTWMVCMNYKWKNIIRYFICGISNFCILRIKIIFQEIFIHLALLKLYNIFKAHLNKILSFALSFNCIYFNENTLYFLKHLNNHLWLFTRGGPRNAARGTPRILCWTIFQQPEAFSDNFS